MKRNAPSIASFFDFKSKTAYPPTTSLASVKGPSIAVTLPPESRTRVLAAVGASPPLAIIVPALMASSLSFPMASINSLGGKPHFSADLTIIMNRIVTPLLCVFAFRFRAGFPVRLRTGPQSWLYCNVERGPAKSTCVATSFRPAQGGNLPRLRLLGGCLGTQALFLRPELGSKLGTEVLRLEHLANLNLGFPFMGTGAALDPLDRLFHRPDLPQPEAGDQLLGLGGGRVDHSTVPSRETDALALRTRVEPLGGEQHAGFHQLFVVLPHFGKELLLRQSARLRVLVGLDYHHESHCCVSFEFQLRAGFRTASTG